MANHSLESFSGGRYDFGSDAASYPKHEHVSAAEQQKNPTQGLVRRLGRTAANWLRNKITARRQASQESLEPLASQATELDANAYIPRHALTSEPVPESPYQPRHLRPTIQAVAVHNGERGLYRSTYAAETTQSPSEHMAEVIRLRDAIAVARTRGHRTVAPRQRREFQAPRELEVQPLHIPEPVAAKPQDTFASFKDTLPPPAASLHPEDAPDAVVTDFYSRRLRRMADDERELAKAS